MASSTEGEFSGYYCKLTYVPSSPRILCIQSRSKDEEAHAITYADEGTQRFVDAVDYNRFEPKQPLDYQQWLMIWIPEQKAYKIINRNSGYLLCVQSHSTAENAQIIQYRDQNLNFQWWEVEAVGSNYKLTNKNSNKVLGASGSSVRQQTYSGSQLWDISSLVFSGYVGEYKIKNVKASKLLCIESRSISNGAHAIIYQDESLNFQWWRIFAHAWDNGAFEIQNTQSGKLLCIESRSVDNDAQAIQYFDQELPFQKWNLSLVSSSSDQVKIINNNSKRLLCPRSRGTGNNTKVIQYSDQDLDFQWWEFDRLSGEINLIDLIRFYDNPTGLSVERAVNEDCPELDLWFQNFLQTFACEVLSLMGVLPSPSAQDLARISDIIMGDASVYAQIQLILAAGLTAEAILSIIQAIWKGDLWSKIFYWLLNKIWSLPTLVKATAFVLSLIVGAGTVASAIRFTKSVIVLGLLYNEKPECKKIELEKVRQRGRRRRKPDCK